jgi:hypothetical protein
MGYATVSNVEARNRSRKLGVYPNPSVPDVIDFLEQSQSEIDGILEQKGYSLPIPTEGASIAWRFLTAANANGAWALMEESAPSSTSKKEARAAYNASLKMLETAQVILGIPKEIERTKPRGPGVSRPPTTAKGNEPYFSRFMES